MVHSTQATRSRPRLISASFGGDATIIGASYDIVELSFTEFLPPIYQYTAIMAIAEYLCQSGLDELSKHRLFDPSKRCRVIDIRLNPRPTTSADVFLPTNSPSEVWESVPTPNIQTWAENEIRFAAANSRLHNGRLVLVYHTWNRCADKYVPFAKGEDFKRFLTTLGLSQSLPYDFARKTVIPLLREDTATTLGVTCQTPHFEETTLTMSMVYYPATKTTFAFVMFCPGEMQFFIDELRKLAKLCSSPLLLPTVLYHTTSQLLAKRLQRVYDRLRIVEIANGKLKHIHRGEQAPQNQDCDRSHMDLVEQHFELTRGLAEFVSSLRDQLHKFSHALATSDRPSENNLDHMISISTAEDLQITGPGLSVEHKELNSFIQRIDFNVRDSLLKRVRFLDRLKVQMEVLYNFKQTRIAEATYADSASMKSLTFLTVIFLPPTAIGTIFGANNFFQATSNGTVTGVTSTFRNIFIPASIIVMVAVICAWILYTYRYEVGAWLDRRSRRRRRAYSSVLPLRQRSKSQCDDGLCRPERVHTRGGKSRGVSDDVEKGSTGYSAPVRIGLFRFASSQRT